MPGEIRATSLAVAWVEWVIDTRCLSNLSTETGETTRDDRTPTREERCEGDTNDRCDVIE